MKRRLGELGKPAFIAFIACIAHAGWGSGSMLGGFVGPTGPVSLRGATLWSTLTQDTARLSDCGSRFWFRESRWGRWRIAKLGPWPRYNR